MMLYNDDDYNSDRNAKQFSINATIVISMLQITIHALILSIKGISHSCLLYLAGAKFAPAIKYHFHFHRLFNPILLHGGNGHLLSNIFSQALLCYPFEQRNGTLKFLQLYILSGISGNIISSLYFPNTSSVGASGAIFGFIGYHLAFLIKTNQPQSKYYGILIVLCLQVLLILDPNSNIDYAAHFGGFATGLLWYQKQITLIVIMMGFCTACIFLLDIRDRQIC